MLECHRTRLAGDGGDEHLWFAFMVFYDSKYSAVYTPQLSVHKLSAAFLFYGHYMFSE